MPTPFDTASATTLRALANGLRHARAGSSVSGMSLNRICPCPGALAAELMSLSAEGMAATHLALLLDARADAVDGRSATASSTELVWTGPEGVASYCRDTSVVVRELFASAERSVLVSTFVLRQATSLLAPLAARMTERPDMTVQVFLHVGRPYRDARHESELLRECADGFRREWPGDRLPEVFYDPRGLAVDSADQATWHAKCVVVDDERAFVTSANFTEWAQQRNVEAGVLIRDSQFASQLRRQFTGLVEGRQVRRVPGL